MWRSSSACHLASRNPSIYARFAARRRDVASASSAACSTVIDRLVLIGFQQDAASPQRLVGMLLMAVTRCASSERQSRPPFRPIDCETMP